MAVSDGIGDGRAIPGAADTPLAESGYSSAPPPRPWGHPDLVLAAAVTAGAITAAEAALIGATRLEGISPHTLAANAQLSDQTLLKRRRPRDHATGSRRR
jgi:hypothetical protein